MIKDFPGKDKLLLLAKKVYGGDLNRFKRDITFECYEPQGEDIYRRILPKDYCPGTFLLSERKSNPKFLSKGDRGLGLKKWVRKIIGDDLKIVMEYLEPGCMSTFFTADQIPDVIVELLTSDFFGSAPIAGDIWNQEYSDIFRKMELLLLTGEPGFQLNTYKDVNLYANSLIPDLFDKFENRYEATLLDWLKLSVASGLVGLNEKTAIDATSSFYRNSEIPVFMSQPLENNIESIYANLVPILKDTHKIDNFEQFLTDVATPEPKTVGIFTDDYIETLFLMKFYEKLLKKHSHLTAVLVPKSRICGNDATYEDVQNILKLAEFKYLSNLAARGRFKVVRNGPPIGGLNLKKLEPGVLKSIINMDILDIRGCRSFEMAQAIKKTAYFSFNIIREISESITGIDGESQQMVFLKQKPGEYSFKGFRERFKKSKKAPSGREFMVVPYTVLDYYLS